MMTVIKCMKAMSMFTMKQTEVEWTVDDVRGYGLLVCFRRRANCFSNSTFCFVAFFTFPLPFAISSFNKESLLHNDVIKSFSCSADESEAEAEQSTADGVLRMDDDKASVGFDDEIDDDVGDVGDVDEDTVAALHGTFIRFSAHLPLLIIFFY